MTQVGGGDPSLKVSALMSDKVVCRTAPATQGLLIMNMFVEQTWVFNRPGVAGAVLQAASLLIN